MALLTRRGYMDLLTRIFETGGLTESMEADLQRLKDDFDEREGILRKRGEVYDGEDRDEYDYMERADDWEARYNEMDGKYHALQQRYTERFFGKSPDTLQEEMESFEETLNDDTTILENTEEPVSTDVMDLFE